MGYFCQNRVIIALMKPLLLHKNTKSSLQSFAARHAVVPHLYNIWHYHREIELLYVIKSHGTRFVGDSIQPFYDGDMVLVGSNVPHFWQNEEQYFENKEDLFGEVILLQFVDDIIQETIALPEMMHIGQLLNNAMHGIQFTGKTRDKAAEILWSLVKENGKNKILELLELLNLMANSEDQRLLSDMPYKPVTKQSSTRIQKVCEYLVQNYRQPISLSEVAEIANLTEKAFCRFFKKSTQKTLIQFITELRISHACKLLHTKEYTIGEICFESGFNNLSNFNRNFLRTVGQTPKEYQKAMAEF